MRIRDFRLLMLDSALQSLVMPIHFITLTFWASAKYPDEKVLYPSLIVAVRGFGLLAMSLLGGAIADRMQRRRVLQICQTFMFVNTLITGIVMVTMPLGDGTIFLVLGLVFLVAANMGIDAPARAASVAAIVPQEHMGSAIGLNNIATQLTFPVVVPLVGFFNGTFEAGYVFLGSLLAWVGIFPAIISYRYAEKRVPSGLNAPKRSMLGDIREGVRYIRRDVTIQAIVLIAIAVQVIAMPGVGALGPVWMTDVLGLSKAQFGLIAMFFGIGAGLSSFFFARMQRITRRDSTLCFTFAGFVLGALIFSYSRFAPLTAFSNLMLGFSMAGTLVTAATVVQYRVADEMRGRVMGLFPLIQGMSLLAVLPIGAAGQAFGLELVVPTMSWVALAAGGAVIVLRPSLRSGPAHSVGHSAPRTAALASEDG
jgi:MFS family permease